MSDLAAGARLGALPIIIGALAASTFISAGSVAISRNDGTQSAARPGAPVAIDELVPGDSIGFIRFSIRPPEEDLAALHSAFGLPAPQTSDVFAFIESVAELDASEREDLRTARRSMGDHAAVAFVNVGGRPEPVGIVLAKDEKVVRSLFAEDLDPGDTVISAPGVVYVGTLRAIRALRAAAADSNIATDARYKEELRVLGDGLAFGFVDMRRAQDALASEDVGPLGPMFGFGESATGHSAAVLRVERGAIVMTQRSVGVRSIGLRSGTSKLLGGAPVGATAGVSVMEPGAVLRAAIAAAREQGDDLSTEIPGLDPERLAAMLGSELAAVYYADRRGGVVADIRDPAALDQVLGPIKAIAGQMPGYQAVGPGFDVQVGDMAVSFRRGSGKISIAVAPEATDAGSLAGSLLRGSGDLGKDRLFSAVTGRGPVTFRLFVDIRAITGLFGGFAEPPEPLDRIRAVGMETRVDGDVITSRFAVMVGDRRA